MPQAIFLDLDSTIITWATPVDEAWKTVCRRHAPEAGLDPIRLYEVLDRERQLFWGDAARHRAGRLNLLEARRTNVKNSFASLNIDNPKLAVKIADAYNAARESSETVTPESYATLENLRQRGIRLAMITNGASDAQRAKINKFNLTSYFDNILVEGEFGCGKPDKRVFLDTLEKLNVPPSSAWMVGDDLEFDIAPCRALGIYSLWVNTTGDGLTADTKIRPDVVIRNISEIPGLL